MAYRIGVISDTHGLIREEVIEHLQGCDRILHAGDIHTPAVVEALNRIAPTCLVRGNADKEWAEAIPEIQVIDDIGIRILMIHNKKKITVDTEPFDLIIYGHSHKYEEKYMDGRIWFNPGSCGPRRFKQPITMAMLYVEDDGTFRIERIDIAHTAAEPGAGHRADDADSHISAAAVKEYLPAIMKEIDKGVPVAQLAKRFGLSDELAEQICRMYLTHPGVDPDGIMRRLGF